MFLLRLLTLCGLCLTSVLAHAEAERPPNVVLIISDDQGWKDYSFMGHPHLKTPHIDKLARESLVYTRGYVPTSLCRPSLASILTGQNPFRHRITGNDPALVGALAEMKRPLAMKSPAYQELRTNYSRNLDALPKLPSALHSYRGYVSFQTGKWWERNPSDCGFTAGMSHGDTEKGGRHGDEGLSIGRQGIAPIEKFMDDAMEQRKPFMVWYAPMMPHTPHNPPQRLVDKYKSLTPHLPIAKYWAMCDWFDESVGELMGALEKRQLVNNTIVLYVVDNGWVQSPSGEGGATGAERGKRSPYDGGTRTPIMVRWPGHVIPRRDDTHLVCSIDLFPTILHAAGVDDPSLFRSLPGRNLLDAPMIAERQKIFGDIYEHDVHDIHNPSASLRYRWVIEGEWKLIEPNRERVPEGVAELYHITVDPDEQQNLATGEPDRVADLRKALDAWWTP
ncbi:MAG: sulfatase [Planctomycetota bacterium]|nr:MAG: sulfatase [Planctomycetota bacterium]